MAPSPDLSPVVGMSCRHLQLPDLCDRIDLPHQLDSQLSPLVQPNQTALKELVYAALPCLVGSPPILSWLRPPQSKTKTVTAHLVGVRGILC